MGPVVASVIAFALLSFLFKKISEKIEFYSRSNLKYRFIDALAGYIHYGDDIGIDESLTLDNPEKDVLERRKEGQEYLHLKLASQGNDEKASSLASKLVDCRFALAKVLMPLLRELEFSNPSRKFINEVRNKTKDGMLEVVTEDGSSLDYVGNDAVHTLGVQSFHVPLQKEINRQMEGKTALLKFSPIAMTSELEKNVNLILSLTGMEQVRYSLSGSEAVDAAIKDVRASCRDKKIIIRFTSAYHGHVSGVDFLNCGVEHVFLPECDPKSIAFIEKYHYRIAGVIVNPMQHFTGINKASPPGEKLTFTKRVRTSVSRNQYALWLHQLQEKCDYCTKYLTKVAFIVDDIYFAFRTPELFSMNYFAHPDTREPLKPNVLVLGKGVALGNPLSMVLGQRGYLNSYDKKYLLQVNKTTGTLSAWYGGLIASNVFLQSIVDGNSGILKKSVKDQYKEMVEKFDNFRDSLNDKLTSEDLPVRIRSFSNTFSIDYLNSSLYNCRFPQYLMAENIFLGNYSTGKFNLNADMTESDCIELQDKFVNAAKKMRGHGYFEPYGKGEKTKMFIKLGLRFIKNALKIYYEKIMEDKHIDIAVSHNHPVNKFGHFWSSVFMIACAYPYILMGYPLEGCLWFFLTHVVRQSGHFFYEHQDRDIEKLKFGHKDASKKEAVAFLILAYVVYYNRLSVIAALGPYGISELSLEQYVSLVAMFTVVPHWVEITYQYGFLRGLSWALKILTDPFTDLIDFWRYCVIHPKWFLCIKDQKGVYQLNINTKEVTKIGAL